MELIYGFIGLCQKIIIILLILVIIFALTVKFHQEHELLKQGIKQSNDEIKNLRKGRYKLIKDMIATFGDYADNNIVSNLQNLISSYPKLKSPKAEAAWERKWSPVMARFIKQVSSNVPQMMKTPFSIAKKSFSSNEKALSAQREVLAEISEEMDSFESNRFKVFFANLMESIMSFSRESHERVIQYEREKEQHEEEMKHAKEQQQASKKEPVTTLHGVETGDTDLFISSLDELNETEPLDREFAEGLTEQPEQLRRRDDMHKAARRNAQAAERESLRRSDDLDGFDSDNSNESASHARRKPVKHPKSSGSWD